MRNLYVIRDKVACEVLSPFYANTDGQALRVFHHAMQDSSYPEDFELICIGTIDVDGRVEAYDPRTVVPTVDQLEDERE